MSSFTDRIVAAEFADACAKARQHLRAEMEKLGLHVADGWMIAESVRAVQGGSEVVMRPSHLYYEPPAGVECVVAIDLVSEIDATCTP